MKKLTVVLCAAIMANISQAEIVPDINQKESSIRERITAINGVVIDNVVFNQKPLNECLKHISHICAEKTGIGFSIIAKNNSTDALNAPITFRGEKLTVEQVLKYIGNLADVSIAITDVGCVVQNNR